MQHILDRETSALCFIDFQEKLLPAIPSLDQAMPHLQAVGQAAAVWQIPAIVTEHCADKIGGTDPAILAMLPSETQVIHKRSFGALGATEMQELVSKMKKSDRTQWLIGGAESHICVLQTVLQLIEAGIQPYILVQGVLSRFQQDYDIALQRLSQAGAMLVTTDMVLYEWCRDADDPAFREILAYVKKLPSTAPHDLEVP